jgi:hypothetical protein
VITDYNGRNLSGGFDYNREQIQDAYRLAYFLHPQPEVAVNVLKEGFDKARLLSRTINKRPPSETPHKLLICSEDLLHVGVMKASEGFEIYQEFTGSPIQRKMSRYPNSYQPNSDDFVIRYIKTIYEKSSDRGARYLAIGIGTLVYRYKTVEILGLSDYFDNNNSSKIKRFYENLLANRFPAVDLKETYPVSERNAKLIECCFDIFTLPSVRNVNFNRVSNVRDEYFAYNCDKSERDKFNVLMKFGLLRLIAEYNTFVPYGSYELDNSADKLMLPNPSNLIFSQPEQNLETRLDQPELTDKELCFIDAFLRKDESTAVREHITSNNSLTNNNPDAEDILLEYVDDL